MKKVIISVLTVVFISSFATSCREKTTGEKLGDAVETVGEGVEDAADDVEDAVD